MIRLARPLRSRPDITAAVIGTVVVVALVWSRRWMSDDGFINVRVVDQVLHGNGFVFNQGERVEVSTSPLWMGFLIAFVWVFEFLDPAWVAVLLGVVLTAIGVAAATIAGARLRSLVEPDAPKTLLLPVTAVVLVLVSPALDFSTSGLEGGLIWAWLGVSFLALTNSVARERVRVSTWVIVGLGVLVRPDLLFVWAAFLVVLALVSPSRRAVLGGVVIALIVPVAYEIFRMGYFGALVPNTAFAKEGSAVVPGRGLAYLGDLLVTGRAWAPLAATGALLFGLARTMRGEHARTVRALIAAPVLGAVLHVAYVVAIGGDYMRGRMLIPALFMVTLPVAVIPLDRRTVVGLAAVVAAVAIPLRVSSKWEVIDERAYTLDYTGDAHPITVADWADTARVRAGYQARDASREGRSLTLLTDVDVLQELPSPTTGPKVVVVAYTVGVIGIAATRDVPIVDGLGLGDVVGGRIERPAIGRAGHEKRLPIAWILARLGVPDDAIASVSNDQLDDARRALRCGDIALAVHAASDRLTFGRFVENLRRATSLTLVRWPGDPTQAAREECGG